MKKGDRAYFIRLGVEPKGIFGIGKIVEEPYASLHWDPKRAQRGDQQLYVDVEFQDLLVPGVDAIVTRERLARHDLSDMHWDAQSSGTTIPPVIATKLNTLWRKSFSRMRLKNRLKADGK
jgi:5-methylcytosine-specific restriction enzyme A